MHASTPQTSPMPLGSSPDAEKSTGRHLMKLPIWLLGTGARMYSTAWRMVTNQTSGRDSAWLMNCLSAWVLASVNQGE